ncbi:MAG: putative bifunctional diguanylate cyclase/phosphodiesterase [Solirubrobacteraceae bacterium]
MGADKATASPAPPAPLSELRKDVHPLGEALKSRTAEVLELTYARTPRASVDATVHQSFERFSEGSTIALARWLAGEGPEVAREAGKETWLFYGQLAAHRGASLKEVTMRCLCWRDAVAEVLKQSAAQLRVSPEALSQALNVLQVSLEFSLIRMAKAFDTERERTDDELAFMATHDALTGLPNRTLLLDRAEQMLARARRHKTTVAALIIGIDNFKSVNDTLSHGGGDELLRSVAKRLAGVLRDIDALGRLGGDEFVVIVDELSEAEGPELVAERLRETLKGPFTLAGAQETRLTVTASIGIATAARQSADEFLGDAEIAMHQAKWDGKNRYVVFEPGMQDAVQGRMKLEMDLRDALANEQFFLVYQPMFNLREMSPNGVEALIRWKHPIRGIVQPNDFIPLLEATGMIIEVGAWVLKEACRQGATWRAAGHPIGVAVNVSGRQLDTDEIVTDVRNVLAESGLDANALTLEVTETTLMHNVEETARRLTAIRELGVRIAIDDFGTGYSSLAYLQQFPVDTLKIDRSFISKLTESPDAGSLVHTLVQLGNLLSIETLAEGVEQPQELSLLQEEQCDSCQGFLFAQPLDAAAAETFLQTWPESAPSGLSHALQRSRLRGLPAQAA